MRWRGKLKAIPTILGVSQVETPTCGNSIGGHWRPLVVTEVSTKSDIAGRRPCWAVSSSIFKHQLASSFRQGKAVTSLFSIVCFTFIGTAWSTGKAATFLMPALFFLLHYWSSRFSLTPRRVVFGEREKSFCALTPNTGYRLLPLNCFPGLRSILNPSRSVICLRIVFGCPLLV